VLYNYQVIKLLTLCLNNVYILFLFHYSSYLFDKLKLVELVVVYIQMHEEVWKTIHNLKSWDCGVIHGRQSANTLRRTENIQLKKKKNF